MVLDIRNNDVQGNQRPPSGGFFVGPVLPLPGARQLILQRVPTTRTIMMNGSAIRTGACLHWNENPPTSGGQRQHADAGAGCEFPLPRE
jgi:hypothetical protein